MYLDMCSIYIWTVWIDECVHKSAFISRIYMSCIHARHGLRARCSKNTRYDPLNPGFGLQASRFTIWVAGFVFSFSIYSRGGGWGWSRNLNPTHSYSVSKPETPTIRRNRSRLDSNQPLWILKLEPSARTIHPKPATRILTKTRHHTPIHQPSPSNP